MIIIRRGNIGKQKKLPYLPIKQRLKESLEQALVGIALGAGIPLFTFNKKIIKYLSPILGSIFGITAGYNAWKNTSKKSIDIRNKEIDKINKKIDSILSNPSKYLNELFDTDNKIVKIKAIGNEFGYKFPEELYKLIKIQNDFIPTIETWIKQNNIIWAPSTIFLVDSPDFIRQNIDFLGDIESEKEVLSRDGVILLTHPEYSDDTFIVWYPDTNTWGFGFENGKGKFKTLKEALISYYRDELSDGYLDKNIKFLLKRYLNFIKEKL